MPTNILVQIPDSIRKYHDHMLTFVQGMVTKLDKNSHKETPTTHDIPGILDLLHEEILEFEEQLNRDKFDENTLIELMDTANFAFLAYVALRMQGVNHGRKNTDHTG